jgi:hypothetical protein
MRYYATMPTTQALQVFYGTIPLILVIAGVWFREQMLLKDILDRLGKIEAWTQKTEEWMRKIERRLTTLETRAGVIFHE